MRSTNMILITAASMVAAGCFAPAPRSGADNDTEHDATTTDVPEPQPYDDTSSDAGSTGLPTDEPTDSDGGTYGGTHGSTDGGDGETTGGSGVAASDSTGVDPVCGDGVLDDDEECDAGEDNGPGQACLADCALNVCGDGDVGPNEGCDDGPANGGGNGCTAACQPNVCGDGELGPGEECDDAASNGPGQACLGDCVVNVCGDGDSGPGEACDDGLMNALAPGACAPNCSTIVDSKQVVISENLGTFDFGDNPIAFLDAACPAGFEAMFMIAGLRQAGTLPFLSDAPLDWPIAEYTHYARPDGTPIWTTDSVRLLGSREGAAEPLENGILGGTPGVSVIWPLTGMDASMLPLTADHCNEWTAAGSAISASFGDPNSTTAFAFNHVGTCGPNWLNATITYAYCVEL
ncbi:MAG: DUF1554 domain-containing protein [Myxococcota bacterium]